MASQSRAVPTTYSLVRSDVNRNAYKMPLGSGHHFASPNTAYWGMISVIMFLKDLSLRWETAGRPFGIGDIGWEDFTGVHSHPTTHTGGAVDIYVIHKLGLHRPKLGLNAQREWLKGKDPSVTLELAKVVLELVTKGGYRLNGGRIAFNDPEAKKLAPSIFITDAERNAIKIAQTGKPLANPFQHDDHMHVQLQADLPYSHSYIQALLNSPYDWE
jgi:murein endopeptidase